MIRLHPLPEVSYDCPRCGRCLEVTGWAMPGMRCLAALRCDPCGAAFYADLPSGHGLMFPCLLDAGSGRVWCTYGEQFFSEWLRETHSVRVREELDCSLEEMKTIRRPIVLNCLDAIYGHSLLKLLNAQYYLDHHPDYELVLLVQPSLRWLVPDGVAAIWTVDLPFSRGRSWFESLDRKIHAFVERFPEAWLSVALPHPATSDFQIERFSRVAPFNVDDWSTSLSAPQIVFALRDDRAWFGPGKTATRILGRVGLDMRTRRFVQLASLIRRSRPGAQFSVTGMGRAGQFPSWIEDLRSASPSPEVDRKWCRRWAAAHIVVGVHGSNMLLPSAHAGATVELVPLYRWGNRGHDLLPEPDSPSWGLCRYTLLPEETSPDIVASVIEELLRSLVLGGFVLRKRWSSHSDTTDDPGALARLLAISQRSILP